GGSEAGIQRMFRAAHTLKGSSAAMGFERMKRLTHEMEHGLDKLRNRQASVSPEVINLFFQCTDRMRRLQDDIVSCNEERSGIDDVVDALKRMLAAAHDGREIHDSVRAQPPDELPGDLLSGLPDDLPIEQLLERAAGRPLMLVSVRLNDE